MSCSDGAPLNRVNGNLSHELQGLTEQRHGLDDLLRSTLRLLDLKIPTLHCEEQGALNRETYGLGRRLATLLALLLFLLVLASRLRHLQ